MQAVLILAHKNVKQVYELSKLLNEQFYVYIHFDAKYEIPQSFIEMLSQLRNVFVIKRINVNWGGYSVALATQNLFKEALLNDKIDYVHVISGQDWPVVQPSEIYNFFDKNNKIYITYEAVNNRKKSFEKIIWWQKLYFDYDNSFVSRKTILGKIYHRIYLVLQLILRVNKFKKLNIKLELYSGSNWVSMPRYAIQYCLDFLQQNSDYIRMFQTGFCSDEFWMQTILCNSKFRNNIINNNYRYINWKKKYNNYPAILDEKDYNEISKNKYFFARKVDLHISEVLLKKLNVWIR